MTFTRRALCLLPILAATITVPQLQAGLLLYDGFDGGTVDAQPLSAIGAGTSSGFATAWSTTGITTNNGNYTIGAGTGTAWSNVDLVTNSNLLLSPTAGSSLGTATNHSRFIRTLDAAAVTGVSGASTANGEIWLSFMGQRNGTTAGGVELLNTTANRFTETFGGFNTNNWNWSDRVTAGTGEVFPVPSTTQAFISVQLVFGATSTTIRMFVNRSGNLSSLTNVPSIENVIQNTSNNRPNFNAISVYGGFKIDELRVGTTYADTAPVNTLVANNAGAGTWVGNSLTTTGGGSLTVGGTQDIAFDGTPGSVVVDNAGVTAGNGRIEFRTGGHTITGGSLVAANIVNTAGSSSITNNVTARFANLATGSTLTLSEGTLTNGLYGAGSLLKTGVGTLTLGRADVVNNDNNSTTQPILNAGRNNYTGALRVSEGTLRITGSNAAGTGPITVGDTADDASLYLGLRADILNPVTVSALGTGTVILGAENTGAGANASIFGGTVTLNRPTTFRGEVVEDRLAFDGKITGNVGLITVTGGNRTTFSSTANDFVGDILVTGTGTILQPSAATAAEVIPNASNVTVDAGAILQLASTGTGPTAAETINALNGAGTVRTFNGGTFGSGLTVGSAGGSGTFSGVLANGAANNPLSLTKVGSGTQILSGANTYTGTTTVTTGTLAVTGSISASSAINVQTGATLDVSAAAGGFITGPAQTLRGAGNVVGATTVNGVLSPGPAATASPGTLTFNSDLTLGSTSTLALELGGTSAGLFDKVAGVSNLTLDGTITVSLFGGFNPTLGASFDVLDWTGTLDASGFALGTDLILPALSPEYMWDTSAFLADGTLAVVPEPSAALSLLGGLGMLLGRRRRA